MTGPPLSEIAAWDSATARGSVAVLGEFAERLPSWRGRVEAVGGQLSSARCWSGPAATVAAAAVAEVSNVATVVIAALLRSLAGLERLADDAVAAQDHAADALAFARAAGVHLDDQGRPDPPVPAPSAGMLPDEAARLAARARMAEHAAELASEARRRGALAAVAAETAEAALGALGVRGIAAPLIFPFLAGGIGPVPVPPAGGAQETASWWAGLPAAAQIAAITADPGGIGRRDGVPAWARDRANRRLLARELYIARGEARAVALRVAGELDALAAAGRRAQLLSFDAEAGLAAVALGDLDTADAVGVLVPGINTTVPDDLPDLLLDARRVADAARAAAPGLSVATVAWLGYRTPNLVGAPLPVAAWLGGPALDGTLQGLASSRAAAGGPAPRTTVIAHSYGTVVTDNAADRPGRLAADAVVLMGSPGMNPRGDLRTEVPELYDAIGGSDPIGVLPWFGGDTPLTGMSPWQPAYGAAELPADLTMGHSSYYDPDHPTLAALGEVVAGTRGPG